jgi:hypothetical protein
MAPAPRAEPEGVLGVEEHQLLGAEAQVHDDLYHGHDHQHPDRQQVAEAGQEIGGERPQARGATAGTALRPSGGT